MFIAILAILAALIGFINSLKGHSESTWGKRNGIALGSLIIIVLGIIYGVYSEKAAEKSKQLSETEYKNLQNKLGETAEKIHKLDSINYDLLHRQFNKVSDLVTQTNRAQYPLPDSMKVSFALYLYNEKFAYHLDSMYNQKTSGTLYLAMPGVILIPKELKNVLSFFQVKVNIKRKSTNKDILVSLHTQKDLFSYNNRADFHYLLTHDHDDPYIKLSIQNLSMPIVTRSVTSLLDLDSTNAEISIDYPEYIDNKTNIKEYQITQDLEYFRLESRSVSFQPMTKFKKEGYSFVGDLHR